MTADELAQPHGAVDPVCRTGDRTHEAGERALLSEMRCSGFADHRRELGEALRHAVHDDVFRLGVCRQPEPDPVECRPELRHGRPWFEQLVQSALEVQVIALQQRQKIHRHASVNLQ